MFRHSCDDDIDAPTRDGRRRCSNCDGDDDDDDDGDDDGDGDGAGAGAGDDEGGAARAPIHGGVGGPLLLRANARSTELSPLNKIWEKIWVKNQFWQFFKILFLSNPIMKNSIFWVFRKLFLNNLTLNKSANEKFNFWDLFEHSLSKQWLES